MAASVIWRGVQKLMGIFMIISAVLLVLAILLIGGLLFWRTQNSEVTQMRQVDVYAEQMRGLERDRAKGVLADDELDSMRAEIGRRMIAAAKAETNPAAKTSGAGLWTLLVVSGAACILGAVIYAQVGSPTVKDTPIAARYAQSDALKATRLSQTEAEAQAPALSSEQDPTYVQLVTELRAALETRPDDIQGHELLAKSESRLGNYAKAHAAQARVLQLKGEAASPDEWYTYAELLIIAADTYISTNAEAALNQTLRRDPNHKMALFRVGMYFDAIGRPDRTFGIWRKLLEAGPESAPYIPLIRRTVSDLAMITGVDYEPPAVKGPSAEDIENAADMSTDDRRAMISGMVTGLADRLATEGGPAPDWAQLILAYGVLGEIDTAQEIFNEALQLFKERPTDLEILRQAAVNVGLMQ
jgi:cytochrome c-type biogenesis protein CcmH|tara:strand:- start:714 stop:1958 length:1245 start_codon:yes stop_codon:yes gene_type:complete